jgi:DNA-binding transcriptional MerR regulator
VKNRYYAHGGTINSEDGTLDYRPSLRETALEILKIIEDVRAGIVKVDREIDELTMALKNPEHPGRCRVFGVVPWEFGFRGDIATYRSRRRRREREEEERKQELEKRLKEHEEKLTADIERRVAAAVNEMAPAQGLPLLQVPSAHKSSCASAAVPEEQRAIEGVQVDNQRYPMDDIYRHTRCELHKPFGNIKMKVCLIHAFITSIIDQIYYFDFCGQAFTMLIITN